jgi:DNA-binding response OmpR family regulator
MTDPAPARIVIADDDSDIRRLVSFTLRRRGHTVYEASDGAEAEELIREERPDLAILDVTMPGQSGTEVVRAIASDAALSHIPMVLLSAKGQPAEIEAGLASGATAYLVKPFTPRHLAEQVGTVLREAGGRDGT